MAGRQNGQLRFRGAETRLRRKCPSVLRRGRFPRKGEPPARVRAGKSEHQRRSRRPGDRKGRGAVVGRQQPPGDPDVAFPIVRVGTDARSRRQVGGGCSRRAPATSRPLVRWPQSEAKRSCRRSRTGQSVRALPVLRLSSAHRTGSDPALVVSPSRCHWRADRWPRRRWMWQPHSVLSRSSSLTRMKLIGLASSFGSMRVAGACGGACSRRTSCGLDQRMVSRLERAALGLRCVPGRSRFGRRVGR